MKAGKGLDAASSVKPEFSLNNRLSCQSGVCTNASSLSLHNADFLEDFSSLCLKVILVFLEVRSPQRPVGGALAASGRSYLYRRNSREWVERVSPPHLCQGNVVEHIFMLWSFNFISQGA